MLLSTDEIPELAERLAHMGNNYANIGAMRVTRLDQLNVEIRV